MKVNEIEYPKGKTDPMSNLRYKGKPLLLWEKDFYNISSGCYAKIIKKYGRMDCTKHVERALGKPQCVKQYEFKFKIWTITSDDNKASIVIMANKEYGITFEYVEGSQKPKVIDLYMEICERLLEGEKK